MRPQHEIYLRVLASQLEHVGVHRIEHPEVEPSLAKAVMRRPQNLEAICAVTERPIFSLGLHLLDERIDLGRAGEVGVVAAAFGVGEGVFYRAVLQKHQVSQAVSRLPKEVRCHTVDIRFVHQRQRKVGNIANARERDEIFDLVCRLVVLLPRIVQKQVVGGEPLEFVQPLVRVFIVESHVFDAGIGEKLAHLVFAAKFGIAG